jgi:hypothetical protein
MALGIYQLLLITAFWLVVIVYPVWRILSRIGFSGAWSILALVPVVNLIALWALSLNRWPIEKAAIAQDQQ